MAGNIKKAALNSPLKSKTKARCVPQPKHSIPKNFFVRQGNMYSSMVSFFCKAISQKNKYFQNRNEVF